MFKIIDSERYISRLFDNLVKKDKIPISIYTQKHRYSDIMSFSYRKKGKLNILISDRSDLLSENKNVDIVFIHEDIFFRFNTSILDLRKQQCVIQKPDSIIAVLNRLVGRYLVDDDEDIFVLIPGYSKLLKPTDISTKGLCLICDEKILYKGQTLNDIKINLPDYTEFYINGKVKRYKEFDGKYIYGITFSEENLALYNKLFYSNFALQ
jgi:hypothetical protein